MSAGWEAAADLVVVGSGVAGLSAALAATELGLRVLVVTKAEAGDGNTRWAQGGVAVVLPDEHEPGDSVYALTRTWWATDDCGNRSPNSTTVYTFVDTTKPSFHQPMPAEALVVARPLGQVEPGRRRSAALIDRGDDRGAGGRDRQSIDPERADVAFDRLDQAHCDHFAIDISRENALTADMTSAPPRCAVPNAAPPQTLSPNQLVPHRG